MDALRKLNSDYLGGHYANVLLIDGWDPRNIDVGLMTSARFKIVELRTHIDDRSQAGDRILSRDCLEATLKDNQSGDVLTLFVNHLKSKLAKTQAEVLAGHQRRQAQARYVADLVTQRFGGQSNQALFAVVGDLNDTVTSPRLQPLVQHPELVDVISAQRPLDDRLTYYWRSEGRVQQIDHLFASRALANRVQSVHIERRGLAYRALNAAGAILPAKVTLTHFDDDGVTPVPAGLPADTKLDFRFQRYPEVATDWRANVSDHCPVRITF